MNRRDCEEFNLCTDSDLCVQIPPERDTFTAGEISVLLKVPRLRVTEAMRELSLQYCSRHNHVPAMDRTAAHQVIRYLRKLLEQDAQREATLKAFRKVS